MVDPRIDALNQMRQMSQEITNNKTTDNTTDKASFKETMKQYLKDANDMQLKADEDIKKIISGDDIDPHQVMLAVEKANTSFDLVMEIRNKMLEAYREVMKGSV
jgi:flagellar hook-basal body complex protein FliE